MSGILIGAFASITRLLLGIASRFNVKGASTEYEKIFGAKGPMQGMGISAALSNAMTTIPQAFNEMTPEMQLQYGPMFNKAIAASKSPEIAAYDQNAIDTTYHSNILNEAGVAYRENWDREVNKVATEAYNKEFAISHDEGKAQSTQNAAINEYKRSHPQEMPQVSTPTKHSGGNFNGVAKVLSNEYFTPTTHHNGGVLGDGNGSFTFDTKSLKTGEMMAFTPNNTQYKVETPDQYSKSRGAFNFDTKSLNSRANNDFASSTYQRSQESTSQYNKSNSANGPIYNMSISISGVASKSDIVHTFTRALNEAVG